MKPQKIIGTYFITLAVFLLLDFLWLDIVAKSFYQNQLGELIGGIYWPAAFAFYLIYAAGIAYLIVLPNKKNNVFFTALKGGFLGLVAYSTYDLTNLTTLENWPMVVVVTDIMWGFLISFLTTLISSGLVQKLHKR